MWLCVCVCVHRKQFQELFFFKPVVVFDFFVSVHCHTQMVYLSIDRPHAKPDLKPLPINQIFTTAGKIVSTNRLVSTLFCCFRLMYTL